MQLRPTPLVLLVLMTACPGPVESPDAGRDAGRHDGGFDGSVGTSDSGPVDDAGEEVFDAGPVGPFDAGPEPTAVVRPVPGELTVIQLDMPFVTPTATGESAIIVGPDGTLVLLDVGNAQHVDTVRNAVKALNTNELTPARGYAAAREPLQVEWVVITHIHSDHVGGLAGLVTGAEPLKITKGVVYRGMVDLGGSLALDGKAPYKHFDAFCPVMRGTLAAVDKPLCHAATTPSCDSTMWGSDRFVATDCDGLKSGNLSTTSDDTAGASAFISLGGQARMTFYGANGYAYDGATMSIFSPAWSYDDNDQENARSLLGIVSQGPFRFVFAGDLTGEGSKDAPDLESFYVQKVGSKWGAFGADVSHANHHARKTSSGPAYSGSLAPKDGQLRNVVAGINAGYTGLPFTGVASPSKDALASWCDDNHLGGGNFWVTNTAPFSSSNNQLVNAQANVVFQTLQGGLGYRMQTTGSSFVSKSFISVRH